MRVRVYGCVSCRESRTVLSQARSVDHWLYVRISAETLWLMNYSYFPDLGDARVPLKNNPVYHY